VHIKDRDARRELGLLLALLLISERVRVSEDGERERSPWSATARTEMMLMILAIHSSFSALLALTRKKVRMLRRESVLRRLKRWTRGHVPSTSTTSLYLSRSMMPLGSASRCEAK